MSLDMRTPSATDGSYSNANCGVRFIRSSRPIRLCSTPCAAASAHVRAGGIDWRLAAGLAPPSVGVAVAGGLVSGRLPARLLLAVIGITLLGFAVDLLRPNRPSREPREPRPRTLIATGLGI